MWSTWRQRHVSYNKDMMRSKDHEGNRPYTKVRMDAGGKGT